MRIAILGSNGHVGRNLANRWLATSNNRMYLYSRNPHTTRALFEKSTPVIGADFLTYSGFDRHEYDVIVNCIGVVAPPTTAEYREAIFRVTDGFDNLALKYLGENKGCRYLNISSGAAYGGNFSDPPDESTAARFNLNGLDASEFYGVVKLYTEAKHRALPDYDIVDLRLFGFFTYLVDINASFLLSEAARSIIRNEVLVTDDKDISRDFVHPDDFYWLANRCVMAGRMNDVLDVYSAAPATKFELLEMARQEFGLKYEIRTSGSQQSIGGAKDKYYSLNRRAGNIGYAPRYSSLESVKREMAVLLK